MNSLVISLLLIVFSVHQQYGFMKNASTKLAALELIDRLLNQSNARKIPMNLHLNWSKAFDSI